MTLWKMEKMLDTSMFSFSHNIFYPSKTKFEFFIHIHFVVCINAFNLGQFEYLWFAKSYMHMYNPLPQNKVSDLTSLKALIFHTAKRFVFNSTAQQNFTKCKAFADDNGLTHSHTMPHFDPLKIYSCENVRKREVACKWKAFADNNGLT